MNDTSTQPREAYRLNDFCHAYGISRSTAYNEIKAGELKPVKVGKTTLIAADAAKAWFARKSAT